ncbi:ribokinase [Ornithinimicrobium cavernae]|uniref:ribokinase n=1 Tax=Ornithinimicrobium cavernae TaxID=2666047 RepID=UPI000D6A039E|nr:ribokinase [Ornithinimicrobium cavernae]
MILVVGSYGAGITIRVPRVPDAGETISGSTLNIGHGGKSSNQAVTVARQGGQVSLLTALGDDAFADAARTMWTQEGVEHTRVKTSQGSTMAGVIVVEPSGENRIAIAPGVLDELTPEDLEAHREAFAAADVVVVCLEVPVATAERAITLARESGATVVLNPAPAASLHHDVIAMADYFVPNESEHEFYVREGYRAPATQTVIVTQGGDGVSVTTGDDSELLAPLIQDTVVDTTGAGDTFVGTFAAALDAGEELRTAVQRAIVASSLSVTVAEVIPSIPGRAAVDDALADYLQNN